LLTERVKVKVKVKVEKFGPKNFSKLPLPKILQKKNSSSKKKISYRKPAKRQPHNQRRFPEKLRFVGLFVSGLSIPAFTYTFRENARCFVRKIETDKKPFFSFFLFFFLLVSMPVSQNFKKEPHL